MTRKCFIIVFVFFLFAFLPVKTVKADDLKLPVVVVIDPGHGGEPGETEANGGANYHDVYEKDLNLETALAMKKELETYQGIEVYITRDSDVEMSLDARAAFAEQVGADMLISIHYNASADHLFYGSEVWVSAFGEYYAKGYGIASCFMEKFREEGLVDRGIKTRIGESGEDYYGIIRHCRKAGLPAVIVEHCYLDDDAEFERADTPDEQKMFGIRDAQAVAQYYGLSKEAIPEKPAVTVEVPVPENPVLPDDTEPQNVVCRVEAFHQETGCADVLVTAEEKESRILYYAYSVDGGRNFSRLFLWEGGESMKISLPLGKSAVGTLQVRLYNNYNVKGDSDLQVYDYRPEEEKNKVYDLEDAYEIKIFPDAENGAEERPAEEQNLTKTVDVAIVLFGFVFFVLAGVLISLMIAMRIQRKREEDIYD